jgi:hypothetical protein
LRASVSIASCSGVACPLCRIIPQTLVNSPPLSLPQAGTTRINICYMPYAESGFIDSCGHFARSDRLPVALDRRHGGGRSSRAAGSPGCYRGGGT